MTMRYLMKGGYWKNSEDEVLKAAVMKYGLNHWSSVSSLIPRKSAKQCKARWYEWLDPSIRKLEWTREEDERLLHLVRVFPSQWRTIAPLVGRTPHQCVERYEELLEAVEGTAGLAEARQLRPGEIDPMPEVRPARADPIDMDDDEREMIAETRVRLANYKGKKAKRKAREHVIEETRRLAQIQKFRELRNAGVDFIVERKQRRKKREFSYGDEVPLSRAPDDLTGELPAMPEHSQVAMANISLARVEQERWKDDQLRKREDDRRKLSRLKKHNPLPQLLKEGAENPFLFFRKEELHLPPPQMHPEELVRGTGKRRSEGAPSPTDLLLPPPATILPAVRTPLQRDLLSYLEGQSADLRSMEWRSATLNPFKELLSQTLPLEREVGGEERERLESLPLPEPQIRLELDLPSLKTELRAALDALGPVPFAPFLQRQREELQGFLEKRLNEEEPSAPVEAAVMQVLRNVSCGAASTFRVADNEVLSEDFLPELSAEIDRRSRARAEQKLGVSPRGSDNLRAFVLSSLTESAEELREDGFVKSLNTQPTSPSFK